MTNTFVPAHILGGSVIEEHQASRFRFYMLTVHGVEILDPPDAPSIPPRLRRVVVRRIHPVVAVEDYRSLLDAFQEVVTGFASLRGSPAPSILHAFGKEGRIHAMVFEPLEGLAMDRIVSWHHEREQQLPVPVALAIAHALLPLWQGGGVARPRLRLRDVVLSPTGQVRAWPELASEEKMMNATEDPDFTYLPYLSPEEIRGKPQGERSDTYRLGMLLYEMLVGQLPFVAGADSFQQILRRIVSDPVPSIRTVRPELPSSVVALVDRATAHRASERFGSWEDLGTFLGELRGKLEPMEADELAAWVQSLPPELHASTEPTLDMGAFERWQELPSLGFSPIELPDRGA